MIERVEYKNYRALRDSVLPLSQFTLLIGPNGSGKCTAIRGIKSALEDRQATDLTLGLDANSETGVILYQDHPARVFKNVRKASQRPARHIDVSGEVFNKGVVAHMLILRLNPNLIGLPVQLAPGTQIEGTGANVAGVLDRLRDEDPERFDRLNDDIERWFPDFDRVMFDTPRPGHRRIGLRRRADGKTVWAEDLSDGTRFAIAILTVSWLTKPPPLVAFEDPDSGIHPRLLREVRDALYRLAYPEQFGDQRPPVQVIATTHSPYMVDLFKDHPEEIVVANKTADNIIFTRLTDLPNFEQIIDDASLGEMWYSGLLGGVPAA